jgi:ABC-type branched-subunit amino acid transport system ATPase component
MLKVEGLDAGYGDVQILWDVNVEIEEGSITALIGSNGVGKTTFMRTVAGALKPFRVPYSFKAGKLQYSAAETSTDGDCDGS